jgi:hypothetical protein
VKDSAFRIDSVFIGPIIKIRSSNNKIFREARDFEADLE